MVIVKLMGGLGNQLFQYAYGRTLATYWDTELVLDVDFLLDRTPRQNFVFRDFDLDLFELKSYVFFDEDIKKKFHQKSFFRKSFLEVLEQGFHYQPDTLGLKKRNIYLDGYWQSPKYFSSIASDLKHEFQFKIPLTASQIILSEKIKNCTSVCVNFRRTDFIHVPNAVQTHGTPPLAYYFNALAYLRKEIGDDLEVFVFSDDVEWCQEHFKTNDVIHYVSHNMYKGERFSSYLQLMTLCKHFIIPNSTFGWWAAWLARNEGKIVITPEQWFVNKTLQSQTQDLRPETWITIDV